MSDLKSRFAVQRKVTDLVGRTFPHSPLDGLSQGALRAWQNANPDVRPEVAQAIRDIAQKLNLLAMRSQDSVDESNAPLAEVEEMVERLRLAMLE